MSHISESLAFVSARACVMMFRTVTKQRPQFGLHPRHLYTAPGVFGEASPFREARILVSDRTLQEQTIIEAPK